MARPKDEAEDWKPPAPTKPQSPTVAPQPQGGTWTPPVYVPPTYNPPPPVQTQPRRVVLPQAPRPGVYPQGGGGKPMYAPPQPPRPTSRFDQQANNPPPRVVQPQAMAPNVFAPKRPAAWNGQGTYAPANYLQTASPFSTGQAPYSGQGTYMPNAYQQPQVPYQQWYAQNYGNPLQFQPPGSVDYIGYNNSVRANMDRGNYAVNPAQRRGGDQPGGAAAPVNKFTGWHAPDQTPLPNAYDEWVRTHPAYAGYNVPINSARTASYETGLDTLYNSWGRAGMHLAPPPVDNSGADVGGGGGGYDPYGGYGGYGGGGWGGGGWTDYPPAALKWWNNASVWNI